MAGAPLEEDPMIRFLYGRVLTLQSDLSTVDWEVWVEGDRIAYAGPAGRTRRFFRGK
jgi:hypothetical protein